MSKNTEAAGSQEDMRQDTTQAFRESQLAKHTPMMRHYP